MGMDSFLEIPTWKEARQVFKLTNFIVANRPGYSAENIGRVLKDPAFRGLNFKENSEGVAFGCLSINAENCANSIFFLETPPISIASTEIRANVKNGKSISGLLPQEIEEYIYENGIYGNDTLSG